MLWLSIKAAAFCRICAQSPSPGRTGRCQARALPFPLLTLRGSLEARRVLKITLQASQSQSLLQKEAGQAHEEHTKLNWPRGGGLPLPLIPDHRWARGGSGTPTVRAPYPVPLCSCSTSLHHVPRAHSAPFCASSGPHSAILAPVHGPLPH